MGKFAKLIVVPFTHWIRTKVKIRSRSKNVIQSPLTLIQSPLGESRTQEKVEVEPLHDGFGDFCFGWPPKFPAATTTSISTMTSFPFLKLPNEIQRMVLKEIIDDLRRLDGKYIGIEVGYTQYEKCLPHRRYGLSIHYRNNLISGERIRMFQMIDVLSKVSHKMRGQVQELFWKNIELYVSTSRFDCATKMLEDRPATHKGIKRLTIYWDAYQFTEWYLPDLVTFCRYISEHLALDDLEFQVPGIMSTIEGILADETSEWIHAFRGIRTAKLVVSIGMYHHRPWSVQDDLLQKGERLQRLKIAMEAHLWRQLPQSTRSIEDRTNEQGRIESENQ